MQLEIIAPDDMHLHLRSDPYLGVTVNSTARQFERAIIMPNLQPPITAVEQALAYREQILSALDPQNKSSFTPLMTLYLTDKTTADTIQRAAQCPHIYAVKLYPAGATTNSDHGLTKLEHAYSALETMEEVGLPLLLHGEVTDSGTDIFDREKVFCHTVLQTIIQMFPRLRIVLEHITTKDARDFVKQQGDNVAATITPHHLLLNRNDLLSGGIKPHHYCLPVLKRETHRRALVEAAISGNPKFFAGTDSAPHTKSSKESSCGCAGVYSAHCALELYAEIFETNNALDKLEGFCSIFGSRFYGIPQNQNRVVLEKKTWTIPEEIPFGKEALVPFRAGQSLKWKIKA